MKRVGVREFRDHATRYLSGDEVLEVERHGQLLGFYIPAQANRRERRDIPELPAQANRRENLEQALERLEQTVQRVLERTGMSEEELSRLFDLNQPLPEEVSQEDGKVPSEVYASGR